MRPLLFVLVLAMAFTGGGPAPVSAQASSGHENLQALPADISRDELTEVMLGFLRALGLPRRAGAGCLHCHEGNLDVPRREWNYSSDAKPTKQTARRMIEMVRSINAEHLAGLEQRQLPSFEVGCVTCHEGRLDPRPLPLLLAEAEARGGVDSVLTTYARIHSRFFGAAAYDLRVGVLANLAHTKAESGDFGDALRLSALNEETHPTDPSARRVTLTLRVMEALDTDGPAAAIVEFESMLAEESREILTYSVLDGVGWRTFRQDREAEAIELFERNRTAFPELYFTFESLVEAQHGAGAITRAEIIQAYETFLDANPGHQMAQQQLTNHRRRN